MTKIKLGLDPKKLKSPKVIIKSNIKDKPIIQIKNVSKSFRMKKGTFKALDDINLSIYKGQNIALLGANGAGKTTLVEIVAGLNKPDKGTVDYNYEYVNSFHEGLGIQFQDSSYPAGLKVKNVIDFIKEVHNVPSSKEEIKNLVEAFALTDLLNRRARSLSGGQQQRLNVLLAILSKPKVVFLDELSTGLDISVRSQIKVFIKEFCEEHGITVVLVSHEIDEIETLADRIVIMQAGKIRVDIPKSEVNKKYGSLFELLNKYI